MFSENRIPTNYPTQSLRDKLVYKIKADWSFKWQTHFGDYREFPKLKNQNAFLIALNIDIDRKLKKSNVGIETISKDNLRRILIQETAGRWQEKTIKVIDIYTKNVVIKSNNKIIDFVKVNLSKLKNTTSFLIICFIILILIGLLVKNLFYSNISLKAKGPRVIANYPATTFFTFEKGNYLGSDLKVILENENLTFIDSKNLFQNNQIAKFNRFQFLAPGLKRFVLLKNDNPIQNLDFLVCSGGGWYGCARIKNKDIPVPFEQAGEDREWYGLEKQIKNDSSNNLTDFKFWNDYSKSTASRLGYLTFPINELKVNDKLDKRVAFVKVDKFNVKMNDITLSFKAKSNTKVYEDCLAFMLQMFDSNLNFAQFYSSATCNVNYNLGMVEKKFINNKYDYDASGIRNDRLNNILNDGLWHNFEFKIKNNQITIKIDSLDKGYCSFNKKLGDLREIWFVFEENGMVDDIKLIRNSNNQILFNDTF